jgi:hypothetical protein
MKGENKVAENVNKAQIKINDSDSKQRMSE